MDPTLTFGPEGDGWIYTRATRTYDLTRGSSRSLTLTTTHGPENTSISVDPGLSALVVVDMQNYFLHPDCRAHPTGLAAVEPTLKVIEKCREVGIQIIWLNWGLTDADLATMPAAVQRSFARSLITSAGPAPGSPVRSGLGSDLGGEQGRTLMAGTWNAELYEPLRAAVRKDEDVFCDKNRMSGMWSARQPLARYLAGSDGEDGEEMHERRKRKKTLFFAGVNTDQCVLGTLTDAYSNGWDCVLLEDCCGTTTPGAQDEVVENAANCYGFVVDSVAFCAGTAL